MQRGYPRPKFKVEETRTGTFKNGNRRARGSWGKKWENKTYPLPYSSEEDSISVLDEPRMRECVTYKKCVACGEHVEGEYVWIMPYNGTNKPQYLKDKPKKFQLHSEAGPFHKKCLKLTMTMCPHIAVLGFFMAVQARWKDIRRALIEALDQPTGASIHEYPRLEGSLDDAG